MLCIGHLSLIFYSYSNLKFIVKDDCLLLSEPWPIQSWQLLQGSPPITQSLPISGIWTGTTGVHRNEICFAGGHCSHCNGDAQVQLPSKFQKSSRVGQDTGYQTDYLCQITGYCRSKKMSQNSLLHYNYGKSVCLYVRSNVHMHVRL